MVLEALSVEAFEGISRGRLLHFDNTLKLHGFKGTEQDWEWHLSVLTGDINYILHHVLTYKPRDR